MSAPSSALLACEVSEQPPQGRPHEWAEATAGISSRPQGDFPSLLCVPGSTQPLTHPRGTGRPRALSRGHTALPCAPGATLQHVPSPGGCLRVLWGIGNQLQRQRRGRSLWCEGLIVMQVGSRHSSVDVHLKRPDRLCGSVAAGRRWGEANKNYWYLLGLQCSWKDFF